MNLILMIFLIIYIVGIIAISLRLHDIIKNPDKYEDLELEARAAYKVANTKHCRFFKSLSHQYISILFIPSYARIVRSEMIRYKELEFVKSAQVMGASKFRIIFVHILPNALVSMLTSATVGFNNAVLAEASMSYLGLGVQPPEPSLGLMLSDAQGYMQSAPWYVIFPGLSIVVIILGFSMISEGLRVHQTR